MPAAISVLGFVQPGADDPDAADASEELTDANPAQLLEGLLAEFKIK